jgi:hypothetical protein
VLSGRVGTKQVHDAAVQLAIACGYAFRDNLVIDTAETFRVAMSATPSVSGYAALTPSLSASYYVYPQPLMGRLDDPFFGMVPPLVSFPPWWRRRAASAMPVPSGPVPAGMANAGAPAVPQVPAAATVPGVAAEPFNPPPVKGNLEITVDATGQVFLRGVVASDEVAREIEQTAWSVPGVTRVVTQFQVLPRRADGVPPAPEPAAPPAVPDRPPGLQDGPGLTPGPDSARAGLAVPPAPPRPIAERTEALPVPPGATTPAEKPAVIAVAALDTQRLTRRVVDSLKRRSPLAELPIKVRSTGDAVMLSGTVPSAFEAMLAYRAAQQTPGVHDVVDRLEFLVPDEDHPNPLAQRGRPEDLEPYLTAQMRRHVGDIAHIDLVRARGDRLEVWGTLGSAADRERVLAILRSIPVLRGFKLNPVFTSD